MEHLRSFITSLQKQKNIFIAISIFLLLLIISNLFLFKNGLWLYQDQSYWDKNSLEAFVFFNTQFHSFINLYYYLGYNQGIFSFSLILMYSFYLIIVHIFGGVGSQIINSLFSYILSFISFFLFSSIFFKNTRLRYILSLFYTFNPLLYSFRGLGIIYCVIPLFVYSFYKYYFEEKHWAKFLLLNVFTSYLWIANVRFLQSNFFLIIPYIVYILFVSHKTPIKLKKIFTFFIVNILIFLPVAYSLLSQLFQKTPGIFNYSSVFYKFVAVGKFYDMFNPFQSISLLLYDNRAYLLLGTGLFLYFFYLLFKIIQEKLSLFIALNLGLMFLGLTFFEMGYIFGRGIYSLLITLFPFLTNAPIYGLYVVIIPFILLLGEIGRIRPKAVTIFATCYILLAILPFFDVSRFIFQKYPLTKIPESYTNAFITPFYGIPEATDYIPYTCWRTVYEEKANTPTQCINVGIRYPSISLDNPKIISGKGYYITSKLVLNPNIDNLRITHNLKNVIVANDIVREKDDGQQYSYGTILQTKKIQKILDQNNLLSVIRNDNFNQYYFKDKDKYDFFIYSPKTVIVRNNIDSIFDNALSLVNRPVIINQKAKNTVPKTLQPNINIFYKMSPFDTTQYYIKLSNVNYSTPFALHLTQTFANGWEVAWIDKKIFDSISCIDTPIAFPITNNQRCQYKSNLLDVSYLTFIGKLHVTDNHHLEGNYLSNTWYIFPKDIPSVDKKGNNDTLYAVIIYKYQMYYVLTIFIMLTTLCILMLSTALQEGLRLVTKYNKSHNKP